MPIPVAVAPAMRKGFAPFMTPVFCLPAVVSVMLDGLALAEIVVTHHRPIIPIASLRRRRSGESQEPAEGNRAQNDFPNQRLHGMHMQLHNILPWSAPRNLSGLASYKFKHLGAVNVALHAAPAAGIARKPALNERARPGI